MQFKFLCGVMKAQLQTLSVDGFHLHTSQTGRHGAILLLWLCYMSRLNEASVFVMTKVRQHCIIFRKKKKKKRKGNQNYGKLT